MLLPWSRRRESEIGPRPNASSLSRQGTPDSARPDLIPSGKALKPKARGHGLPCCEVWPPTPRSVLPGAPSDKTGSSSVAVLKSLCMIGLPETL